MEARNVNLIEFIDFCLKEIQIMTFLRVVWCTNWITHEERFWKKSHFQHKPSQDAILRSVLAHYLLITRRPDVLLLFILLLTWQSSEAVWKSRWPSWAPVPNKPTVSVDVKQHFNQSTMLTWHRKKKRKVTPTVKILRFGELVFQRSRCTKFMVIGCSGTEAFRYFDAVLACLWLKGFCV